MTEIRFYHLQRKTINQALPEILNKIYSMGKKVIVKTADDKKATDIDKLLWSYQDTSFLPHGKAKDLENASKQPILITTEDQNLNSAEILILLDSVTSDYINDYDICCEIFDGNNQDALNQARQHWKEYKELDIFDLVYYQQSETGAWAEKTRVKAGI